MIRIGDYVKIVSPAGHHKEYKNGIYKVKYRPSKRRLLDFYHMEGLKVVCFDKTELRLATKDEIMVEKL